MDDCPICGPDHTDDFTHYMRAAGKYKRDLDLANARVAVLREGLVTVMNVGDRAAVMVAQGALYDEVAALAPGEPKEGE